MDNHMEKRPHRWLIFIPLLAAAVVIAAVILFLANWGWEDTSLFDEKAELLAAQALDQWVLDELGSAPAGEAGHAAFLSVSNGETAAQVFSATGGTPQSAYEFAVKKARRALEKSGLAPVWLKADLVYISHTAAPDQLAAAIEEAGPFAFHYGLSPTPDFSTPLLEAQLNARRVYQLDGSPTLALEDLNACLADSGYPILTSLPEEYTLFQCASWLCDESKTVIQLSASGHDYGRRQLDSLNAEYALALTLDAATYLAAQAKEEGGFHYGYNPLPPAGDAEETHAFADQLTLPLRALIRGYSLTGDEPAGEKIKKSMEYVLSFVMPEGPSHFQVMDSGTGNVPDLRESALALLALTDYAYAFESQEYMDECQALGDAITGYLKKSHAGAPALQGSAEALSALCALYSLTEKPSYLDMAQQLGDDIMANGLDMPGQDAIARAMNDLTKCVSDNPNYYAFALEYAKRSMEAELEGSLSVSLLFLTQSFETYDRMLSHGGQAEGFPVETLVARLLEKAQMGLDSYFYPEYAMYVPEPQKAAGAFMDRENALQVNIQAAASALEGYYSYFANYSRMEALVTPE